MPIFDQEYQTISVYVTLCHEAMREQYTINKYDHMFKFRCKGGYNAGDLTFPFLLRNYKNSSNIIREKFNERVNLNEKDFSDFEKTSPLKNRKSGRNFTPAKEKYSQMLKGLNYNNIEYIIGTKRNTQADAKWANNLRFNGTMGGHISYIAKNNYSFKA